MAPEEILSVAYKSFCITNDWTPRCLIIDGLSELERSIVSQVPSLLLLDLPTAYGKTTITAALAKIAIEGNPLFSRIIHVLPMRSIADQLGEDVKRALKLNALDANFTPDKVVSIQHMGISESPYFARKVVLTTLDTFVLNFYKAPVSEYAKIIRDFPSHHEFARGHIYSGLVIFDEFHLFSSLGTNKELSVSLTSVLCAIKGLCLAGVPVIVMTATIPAIMKQFISSELKSYGINLIEKIYKKGDDPSYEMTRGTKKFDFELIQRSALIDQCEYLLSRGKVMFVMNTVKSAVETYCKLKRRGLHPLLLHGKLTEDIRKARTSVFSKSNDIDENTPALVVATQVIESGVNLSFDFLITEPCPPDRLIQRVGRVARKSGATEGKIFIVEDAGTMDDKRALFGPYDPSFCIQTTNVVINKKELNRQIIDTIYSKELIKKDEKLWQVLAYLDNFTLLSSADSRDAIKYFSGFTDSFGIITGFMEDCPTRENAVGLSEKEAKKELQLRKKLIDEDGNLKVIGGKELYVLLNSSSLSLELESKGYQGVAIGTFDKEIGYASW